MINFDSKICTDFEAASSREWLETNGIGGFCFRNGFGREHAPLSRAFNGGDASAARTRDDAFQIRGNFNHRRRAFRAFRQSISERRLSARFSISEKFSPRAVSRLDFRDQRRIEIEKSVFMVHGENSTIVQYRIRKNAEESENLNFSENRKPIIQLELKPLISFVDYHHLQHETVDFI
jgi:hypothetical protein